MCRCFTWLLPFHLHSNPISQIRTLKPRGFEQLAQSHTQPVRGRARDCLLSLLLFSWSLVCNPGLPLVPASSAPQAWTAPMQAQHQVQGQGRLKAAGQPGWRNCRILTQTPRAGKVRHYPSVYQPGFGQINGNISTGIFPVAPEPT